MKLRPLVLLAGIALVSALLQAPPAVSSEGNQIAVPCKSLDATITFTVQRSGDDLVLTVQLPCKLAACLVHEEWSANVGFYLDTDANRATGSKGDEMLEPGSAGAEYRIYATQVTTPVAQDAEGNWISKPKLLAAIDKGDDSAELPEGYHPKWEIKVGEEFQPVDWVSPQDSDTLRLVAPLSVFGLKAGATIRVAATAPNCNVSFPYTATGKATITLN